MEIFAKRIAELRKDKGLSQSQLSKEIGISQAAIAFWEAGERIPGALALITISKYFKVSADYLLGLEDETGAKIYE
ncbi:MAG: helix-turn-helix transcriptional regulator [Clostridia bacterium]|jgi:transcriptional regulator with XRE-family HTH domain|nr:helix-turn-helix transcriptional regulator [Clostridia bacterium]